MSEERERIAVLETDLKNTKEDMMDLGKAVNALTKEITRFHFRASIAFVVVFIELKLNLLNLVLGVFK